MHVYETTSNSTLHLIGASVLAIASGALSLVSISSLSKYARRPGGRLDTTRHVVAFSGNPEFDSLIRDVASANVSYTKVRSLGYGEVRAVELRILNSEASASLLRKIKAHDKNIAQVGITDLMEARLSGDGFVITSHSPVRQAVNVDKETLWVWDVRAERLGNRRLCLVLDAIVKFANESAPHTICYFEQPVAIGIVWPQSLLMFWEDNWKWVLAAAGGTIGFLVAAIDILLRFIKKS
jgi:hypothetical protein